MKIGVNFSDDCGLFTDLDMVKDVLSKAELDTIVIDWLQFSNGDSFLIFHFSEMYKS